MSAARPHPRHHTPARRLQVGALERAIHTLGDGSDARKARELWTTRILQTLGQTRSQLRGWRELLGDEADALSDQNVDLIRQHADAMGRVLVEIFLENRPTPE